MSDAERALLAECLDFTKYVAAIRWERGESNTQEWLDGLRAQIELLQPKLDDALKR